MIRLRPTRGAPVVRAAFALFVVAAAAASALVSSSADITVTNQPASEGRPITPAGSLVSDLTTRQPAVGALPVAFVRSPDKTGPDGRGRYLVAVNSGYGLQFNAASNRAQQSLAVIDLNTNPAPAVVQNIYFPTPQSVNVGAAFSPRAAEDGSFTLYASGGFENKIWIFRLRPGAGVPLAPASPGPDTKVDAPFIDVSGFASTPPSPRYNNNHAPVYPTGLAVSDDGDTLYVADNLGDSLGVVRDLRGEKRLEHVALAGQKGRPNVEGGKGEAAAENFVYPYAVVALPVQAGRDNTNAAARGSASKVYVSCWNDASVAVVDFSNGGRRRSHRTPHRHP